MNVIKSACNGFDKRLGGGSCPLRHGCRRYNAHLNATIQKVSYIKAAFVGQSCDFFKE